MFEAGVDDFFDAECVLEVVEARVHILPQIADAGIRVRDSGVDAAARHTPVPFIA